MTSGTSLLVVGMLGIAYGLPHAKFSVKSIIDTVNRAVEFSTEWDDLGGLVLYDPQLGAHTVPLPIADAPLLPLTVFQTGTTIWRAGFVFFDLVSSTPTSATVSRTKSRVDAIDSSGELVALVAVIIGCSRNADDTLRRLVATSDLVVCLDSEASASGSTSISSTSVGFTGTIVEGVASSELVLCTDECTIQVSVSGVRWRLGVDQNPAPVVSDSSEWKLGFPNPARFVSYNLPQTMENGYEILDVPRNQKVVLVYVRDLTTEPERDARWLKEVLRSPLCVYSRLCLVVANPGTQKPANVGQILHWLEIPRDYPTSPSDRISVRLFLSDEFGNIFLESGTGLKPIYEIIPTPDRLSISSDPAKALSVVASWPYTMQREFSLITLFSNAQERYIATAMIACTVLSFVVGFATGFGWCCRRTRAENGQGTLSKVAHLVWS